MGGVCANEREGAGADERVEVPEHGQAKLRITKKKSNK